MSLECVCITYATYVMILCPACVDENRWIYMAQLVLKGSDYSSNGKRWDIMALEISSHINILTLLPIPSELNVVFECSYSDDLSVKSSHHLVHAQVKPTGLTSSAVAENQMVCLMGYPGFKALNVKWGRVDTFNYDEILVNIFSDFGSSGGPLFDREGRVVGVLSISYNTRSFSCVTPLRDIVSLIRRYYSRLGTPV
jgi:Trypsin-like peptidase domain